MGVTMGVGGLEVYWGRVQPDVMPVTLGEVPSPSASKAPLRFDAEPLPAAYPIILGILRMLLTKPPSIVGFLSSVLSTKLWIVAGGLRSLLGPAFCNPRRILLIRCWSSTLSRDSEGFTV